MVASNLRQCIPLLVDSLAELQCVVEQLRRKTRFIYRGQSNATWPLASSFERKANQCEVPGPERLGREELMIQEFRRFEHLHIGRGPARDDSDFEWLSWMQHYGCPTRLLDVTASAHVAAFFAVTGATTDCAVWAIDVAQLPVLSDGGAPSQRGRRGILTFRPKHGNERLARQRGEFLVPNDVNTPFLEHLCAALRMDSTEFSAFMARDAIPCREVDLLACDYAVVRMTVPRARLNSFALGLDEMNVSSATLFSGLSGFCESLGLYLLR